MNKTIVVDIEDKEYPLPPIRMLSTEDNPFNPFTHWEEWYAFDTQNNYNTLSYLARIINETTELSDLDQALAIDDAIERILKMNLTGNYISIEEKTFAVKKGLIG